MINTGKVYDATNDFKFETNPVENPTPLKLQIHKNLLNFVDHGNDVTATFTFSIQGQSEAYGGLYSTIRAVEFTGMDGQTITVSGIPAADLLLHASYHFSLSVFLKFFRKP